MCRKLEVTGSNDERGKLSSNWKDSVKDREDLDNGAYRLETLDGKLIPRTWNMDNLRISLSKYNNSDYQ